MKYIIKACLGLMMLIPNLSSSQSKDVTKTADKAYEDLAYVGARESYLKASGKGTRSTDLLKKLGDSYYYNADYKNAAKWYGQLYDASENLEADYLYRYALSLKSDENYVASDKIMEEFSKANSSDTRANLYVNERNYLDEIELQSGRFEMNKMNFNSELSDFAPTFYQGSIIYSSNRSSRGVAKRVHNWNNQPFLDLYKLNSTSVDKPSSSKFSSKINSIYHESTAIFTKDGETMYFTRNNFTDNDYKDDESGTNKLKLYRATRSDDGSTEWEVEELPFNSDEYSVAHPALSPDEQTLYFASDMPGTNGLSDIYKVAIIDNAFGEIKNLGNKINTEGRETFPFISKDNKLYFASDGHMGLGGLDIFVSELGDEKAIKGLNDDTLGEVFNIGKPLNGPKDDFTFIIDSDKGEGYFASNREGGEGFDDIYHFRSIKPLITKCEQSIDGFVLNREDDKPIGNATVYLLGGDNKVLEEKTSRADGSFNFVLDCSKTYAVRSSKETYSTTEKVFDTPSKTGSVERTLFLKKDAPPVALNTDVAPLLGINMLYFDLDKDFIRSDAEVELRKVIDFMNVYKNISIDVRSHTDSRNTTAYNDDLSNRRAQSTINYLVNVGGISRSRLTGQGYGERELRNRCSDGVKCSESEHQLNRRSQFIVVK